MDLLQLRKTRKILELVAANEGLFGWYGIAIRIDGMPDVEINPSAAFIAPDLVKLGYLEEASRNEKGARYRITKLGLDYLNTSS